MTPESLLTKLKASFPKCVPVTPDLGTVRCERTYDNRTRGIYFFQSTATLPSDRELARIHQDIVSPSYFEAQDSSRWSHYVIFVANDGKRSDQTFVARQKRIEEDKDYARKLVVYESELDSFLDHSIIPSKRSDATHSVVAVWAEELRAAGLTEIQADTPRAPVIRTIRAGTAIVTAPPTTSLQSNEAPPKPSSERFVRTLDLVHFDARKLRGTFRFARVNLIRGPNGSGKTSLLEAIEHFFCGATLRSGGRSEDLSATMTFTDGKSVSYQTLANSKYQESDLRWYGRTINRGNRLYEGFSRFNFLNTDAAAQFSNEADLRNLKDVLAKIALGPDAAHTWNRISEFERDISGELTTLNGTLQNLDRTIAAASERLFSLEALSPQSEAHQGLLLETLSHLTFPVRRAGKSGPDAEWFKQFNSLRALRDASKRAQVPVSVPTLTTAIKALAADLEDVVKLRDQSSPIQLAENELRRLRSIHDKRSEQLRRLSQYLTLKFPELCQLERETTDAFASLTSRLIAETERESLLQLASTQDALTKSVNDFRELLAEELARTREQVEEIEHRRNDLQKRLSTSAAAVAEILRFGRQFTQATPDATECPLCHTEMTMSDLMARMDQATLTSAISRELDTLARSSSAARERLHTLTAALLTLERTSAQEQSVGDIAMAELIEQARRDRATADALKAKIDELSGKFTEFERSGFNKKDYTELMAEVLSTSERFSLESGGDSSSVARVLAKHSEEASAFDEQAENLRKTTSNLIAERARIARKFGLGSDEPQTLHAHAQSELSKLRKVLEAFDQLPFEVRTRFSDDLTSLLEGVERCCLAIDGLNSQLQAERSRDSEIGILRKQLSQEQAQWKDLHGERTRLSNAIRVLRDLQSNHSLETGLTTFIADNLEAIQRIFTRIHVPHELRLSSLADCTLERAGYNHSVDLSQISTGQRAALMLSVFVTLNLSLRNGPPLMLIDDPIAHIDDLNALSFLDFMADVAESAQRQLFFSTANEKLANLFEKKMGFLGHDFTVFDLGKFEDEKIVDN